MLTLRLSRAQVQLVTVWRNKTTRARDKLESEDDGDNTC